MRKIMDSSFKKTVEELKKENFDLKLRLYMTQKHDEPPRTQPSPEDETKLIALVHRLEQQQSLNENFEEELQAARMREKRLLAHQKLLEQQCAEQRESIQDLVLNISHLSAISGTPNMSFSKSFSMSQSSCITPRTLCTNPENSSIATSVSRGKRVLFSENEITSSLPTCLSTGSVLHRPTPFASASLERSSILSKDQNVMRSNIRYTPRKRMHSNNVQAAHFSRSQGVLVGVVRPSVKLVADDGVKMKSPISARDAKVKKKKRSISRLLNFCKAGSTKE